MTPELWQRVKEILDEASEKAPPERAAYLDQACAGDAALRSEVESLLASLDEAGEFIEPIPESPRAAPPRDNLAPGSELGPYRIVQQIAEGGMGVVYQAVRVDDLYRKVVAIKVIKRGIFGDYALKRFETERQILAHLDHPSIAKLLDGGTTPSGLPYFVMDFIAGTPIDEYCDAQRLNVQERIDFFLTVCAAVHYAHQNLVIHRDLKPQNIMVTPDGAVKLLDFGIAKLLDPEPRKPGDSITTMQPMTPEYASPEQLHGLPVTTASDVYSLGVLLYRLLTGRRPYALSTGSIQEIWESFRVAEPRKPSTVIELKEGATSSTKTELLTAEAICAARSTRADRLSRELSGDLDNILLMSLRREPERRYASAEQFAGDLRRYRAGHPVLARQDTIRYRTSKFIRRHQAGVAAAALVLVTLIAGVVATAWQAHVANRERLRAVQRFNDVRGLANTVLFELHDAIARLPGSTQTRELLVKRAQQYLDKLASEQGGDDSLQHERAMAYQRVGDVLGLPSGPNLGQTSAAIESYGKALAIDEPLARRYPDDYRIQMDLSQTYNRVCRVHQGTGRFQEALAACLKAEGIQQVQAARQATNPQLRAELASTYTNLAGSYLALGDWRSSLDRRAKALHEFEDLHRQHPEKPEYDYELAIAHHRMANLLEQTKEYRTARDHAAQAVSALGNLVTRYPGDQRYRVDGTMAQQRLGSILISLGDLKGALDTFTAVLPVREQLRGQDPQNIRAHANVANTHAAIGVVLLLMDRPSEAEPHFEEQRKIGEYLVRSDPLAVDYRYSLSEAYENLGRVFLKLQAYSRARAYLENAKAIYDVLERQGAISAEYRDVPARIAGELAQTESGSKGRAPVSGSRME